jgi:hypothetical protein
MRTLPARRARAIAIAASWDADVRTKVMLTLGAAAGIAAALAYVLTALAS